MRRILVLQVFMIAPLLALTFLSVALGHSLNPTADDFVKTQDCRLPCWNGIRAGVTAFREAADTLDKLGYRLLTADDSGRIPNTLTYRAAVQKGICQIGVGRSGARPTVSELTLQICDGAILGHIVDMLGEPETVLPIVSMVSYQKGQIAIILSSRICQKTLSPHTPLLFIDLTPQITLQPQSSVLKAEQVGESDSESTNLPWRGFIPVWRYNQLFPGRAIC